ncbi:MAG: chemotaxis protein CheD [Halobacteriales archaeon]
MQTTSDAVETRRRRLGIAEHEVATEPAVLTTSGLGSCVGIALYDGGGRGGLAHCMLPSAADADDADAKPAKYVDTAIETLRAELVEAGASPGDLRAKIAGGSDMLGLSGGPTVGERNAAAAREELDARGIPVVATETGGGQGRSLAFETATGRLSIAAADGSETDL